MNPTIKRLLGYCARYPRWLIQAGICLLLATGAEVAGPLLIKLFIDDYLAPRQLVWPAIAAIAAGYLGLQVLSAAGFYLQSLRFNSHCPGGGAAAARAGVCHRHPAAGPLL